IDHVGVALEPDHDRLGRLDDNLIVGVLEINVGVDQHGFVALGDGDRSILAGWLFVCLAVTGAALPADAAGPTADVANPWTGEAAGSAAPRAHKAGGHRGTGRRPSRHGEASRSEARGAETARTETTRPEAGGSRCLVRAFPDG